MARNISWNALGVIVDAFTSFLVTPYLVSSLGEVTYGLWFLIGSVATYFLLLDLGVRASVGRFLAFHRAAGDRERVNSTLSCAFMITSISGLVLMLLSLIVIPIFPWFFRVPTELKLQTEVALALMCLNLALSFPLSLPDSMLWAAQRFDTLSKIDIPATIYRAVATYIVIREGYGLIALALIMLSSTIGMFIFKGILAIREDPEIRVSLSLLNRETIDSLFGYGKWNFARSIAIVSRYQLVPTMIGRLMGPQAVTFYSFPRRLLSYAEAGIVASTGALVPLATAIHSKGEEESQRTLFVEGGKFNAALAFFFLAYFFALGREFLILWLGSTYYSAGDLLMILAVGETIGFSQLTTVSIILATARHKFLTLIAALEMIPIVIFGYAVANTFKLPGICVVLSLAAAVFRGMLLIGYGCRFMRVSIPEFLKKAMLPAVMAALIPGIVLKICVFYLPPHNWVQYFALCFLFALIALLSCLTLLSKSERIAARVMIQKRLAPDR